MDLLLMLFIVVAVSFMASGILSTLTKEKEKKDIGFAFSYHRLTHRRRLIRTLWLLPVSILLFAILRQQELLTPFEWTALVMVCAIVFACQALYEYRKWKKFEKEE